MFEPLSCIKNHGILQYNVEIQILSTSKGTLNFLQKSNLTNPEKATTTGPYPVRDGGQWVHVHPLQKKKIQLDFTSFTDEN